MTINSGLLDNHSGPLSELPRFYLSEMPSFYLSWKMAQL